MIDNQIRAFSAIQPTGNLTIGNYLGAMAEWVKMQQTYDCMFCIADLHAITIPSNFLSLQKNVIHTLACYLAAGININKVVVFQQSMVPQHTELAWILGCMTRIGWLNRMTQFKDKSAQKEKDVSFGLYAYPVLMASDILLYHATHVPIGNDQKQHLELTRDIATAVNNHLSIEYFSLPKPMINTTTARIMSLCDASKKMSKSDIHDKSRINLMDSEDTIALKIKQAKTDSYSSIWFDIEKRPEISNLINIYAAVTSLSVEKVVLEFQNLQNKHLKEMLTEALIQRLNPIRNKAKEIEADKTFIHSTLTRGAEKAQIIANNTLAELKKMLKI